MTKLPKKTQRKKSSFPRIWTSYRRPGSREEMVAWVNAVELRIEKLESAKKNLSKVGADPE